MGERDQSPNFRSGEENILSFERALKWNINFGPLHQLDSFSRRLWLTGGRREGPSTAKRDSKTEEGTGPPRALEPPPHGSLQH